MRGRHDWNRLLRHVDPKTQTGLVNIWEPIAQEFHWFVGDIKKNALRPGAFDLGVNRSSHNIPRCERTASIVAFHEIFAAIVPKKSDLASNCFLNQNRFCYVLKSR